MGKESEKGIGCSSELPFLFEINQALVVILVEHSRKAGDLISLTLFAFLLMEGKCEVASGRCIHCWILPLGGVCSGCYPT